MNKLLPDFRSVKRKVAIYEFRLGEDHLYTYGDLESAIAHWKFQLKKWGLSRGDFIAILSENRFEWVAVLYASLSMGCVLIPLDAKATRMEWAKVLADSEPKVLLFSTTFSEETAPLIGQLKNPPRKFSLDDYAWDSSGVEHFDGQIDLLVHPEDIALIIYTSGTTGEPKGVMIPRRSLIFQVERLVWKMNLGTEDVILSINPFNHLFELTCAVLTSIKVGDELVICSSLYPEDILRLMRQRGVTRMMVVPLFLRLMMNSMLNRARSMGEVKEKIFHFLRRFSIRLPYRPLRRRVHPNVQRIFGKKFREFVAGGAPLDSEVANFFESLGIAVYQGYGMTESGPTISVNNLHHNKLGSVGRPLPDSEVKILRKSESEESGEIIVRGPHLMLGYYKRPDLTNGVLRDGWLHTGDLGHLDDDGYLWVTGRNKDLIVLSGGKKVQPEEVEIALQRSPHIREVCVVGIPQQNGALAGSIELTAVIVPQDSLRDHEARGELENFIREELDRASEELAPYKRPSAIRITWDELPKTSTRKIKRVQVLKRFSEVSAP